MRPQATSGAEREQALDELERFHAEVDQQVAALARRHGRRLRCRRGCSDCCVDELTVFEVEAARITRHHAQLLREGRPRAAGGCALLDDAGACRIYADRPYVCRTQGLPLRWLEEASAGRTLELRDICPLNAEAGPPVETLTEELCWTLGPIEERLARLQIGLDGGAGRRIRLRDLFLGVER